LFKRRDEGQRRNRTPTKGDYLRDGSEYFGPGKTWAGLYEYANWYMRMRFPWQEPEMLADAASEGLMRSLGKDWPSLEAKTEEQQERNWNYARRVIRLEALEWMGKECQRPEVPVSALVPDGMSPEQEQDYIDNLYGADTSFDGRPGETVEARDEQLRANAVLRELASSPEWETWLKDLVHGRTERETAEEQGVSHQAVHKRRVRGMARIRPVLIRHGLIEEERGSTAHT